MRDLFKYYGTKRALGPVSATIEKGEVIGLLGLNGAGKTTALRILACDLLPTAGTVRVAGVDVAAEPDVVRSRIGYLPDRPPLYDEMRVSQYLAFAYALRGKPASQAARRVGAVAEQLGLRGVLDAPVSSLSHGYRQRVGIAQAIVHEPELVVLDEPISGLDPVQIVEMRALVRGLSKKHTVVVSSHILSEISETCDRLIVLREGTIVAVGSEQELSSQFRSGLTAELTVRTGPSGHEHTVAVLRAVPGVSEVEAIAPLEPGPNVLSYRVRASRDVRGELVLALSQAGVPLIGLAKADLELENVFLRLAGSQPEEKAA